MKESIYKRYEELPLFLNAATVTKVLGVSPSSGYELMHEPDFPVLKIGSRMVVPKEYYGNITPYDRQICSSTSLRNAMDQSHKYEEQLTKLLEGEAHSLLLRLINAENEIGSTLALENFILGFRLGTRLILEALDEDDGSLMELLRRDGRREEQG